MGEIRILTRPEIQAALDMASCIEVIERAFTAYAAGRAELPAVIQLDVPERGGEIHIKAGYLHGEAHYAVKVVSGFPSNAAAGLPAGDGLVMVFDAATGAPAALLLDGGLITDVRTGAAGGVAAKHLGRREPGTVAVIGTGAQARHQLEALSAVRSFHEVRIWGRDAARAEACANDIAGQHSIPRDCRVTVVPSVREAVEGAGVVITATASREPLLRGGWLSPGAHVTAVGSDQPDKQELDPEVLGRADLVVADSREQCVRFGELHHAAASGAIDPATVVELGSITAGDHPGRTTDDQITVCDLTGVGVQDVAAAGLVLARAGAGGRRART